MTWFTQNCIVKPGVVALCLALAVSPVYGVGMCSIGGSSHNFNFQSSPDNFNFLFSPGDGLTDDYSGRSDRGGISLDRTLTLLNDIANIRGAAYDPAKGEVVFIGEGTVPIAEKIDIDDLVVALRSVYVKREVPGIDIGVRFPGAGLPPDGQTNVTYHGDTKFTAFGKTLYEADLTLKMLGLGIDAQGNKISSTYPGLAILGYASVAERALKMGSLSAGVPLMTWLQPADVTMRLKPGAGGAPSSFVFDQVQIKFHFKFTDPSYSPPPHVVQAMAASVAWM